MDKERRKPFMPGQIISLYILWEMENHHILEAG